MVVLWPLCGFADADDVVNRFYAAYPNEEPDPFMAEYVQQIIGDLGWKPCPSGQGGNLA